MNISTTPNADLLSRLLVSDARAMPKPGAPNGPKLIELNDEARARVAAFEEGLKNHDKVRAEIREQQSKVKAHTVFTVGGKMVAMQWANGWTGLHQGAYAASDVAKHEGADKRAAYIEKTLREIYGNQLEVHDFSADPNAPTMGELEPVIQYKKSLQDVLSARSGGAGGSSQLLALTGTSMSILQGRSR
ncbi:MAG: hypothetical protein WCZ23_13470 [Rhodospirillaceae bacterium]